MTVGVHVRVYTSKDSATKRHGMHVANTKQWGGRDTISLTTSVSFGSHSVM